MSTREQLAAAEPLGRAEVVHVVVDYYEKYPKPCLYGWVARQLTVVPNDEVLSCPDASDAPAFVMRGPAAGP
jgi:pyrroloquinoline quinone biosynthesis protein E